MTSDVAWRASAGTAGSPARLGRRPERGRLEQAVQVVVEDRSRGLVAALSAQDAGGQAVGEGQERGHFDAWVAIGADVSGLLSGGEPCGEEVFQRVGPGERGGTEGRVGERCGVVGSPGQPILLLDRFEKNCRSKTRAQPDYYTKLERS